MTASEKEAFQQACRFLAPRARTRSEVCAYLEARGWHGEVLGNVLLSLERVGYINDLELARSRVECCLMERGWGPRKVAAELTRRGVEEEVWRQVLDEAGARLSERELAEQALARKYGKDWERGGGRLRARAFRFLLGRGFQPEVAEALLGLEQNESWEDG